MENDGRFIYGTWANGSFIVWTNGQYKQVNCMYDRVLKDYVRI